MMSKSAATLLAATLLLTACQSGGTSGSETMGASSGPMPGTQLNGQVTDDDKRRAAAAEQNAYAAPVGQQITWHDPQNGNSGTITPVHDGYSPSGVYCREFQQTITIGGQQQQGYGNACQQPDGSWKVVK